VFSSSDSVTFPSSGNLTGLAFVEFQNEDSAKAALDTLGGTEIQAGVKLLLSYAHQREGTTRDRNSRSSKQKRRFRLAKDTDPFGLKSN
jgi:RNA recognition motif-containing protein